MKVADLTRPEMHAVATGLLARLVARQQAGPPEPALDAFIPELSTVAMTLDTHVTGKTLAHAQRLAALAKVEEADIEVDTWLRHHHAYLQIEAGRRAGPNVLAARALFQAAFPDGLAHVDDYVPDENQSCRAALVVLNAPENAATIAAIGLPPEWPARWAQALDASDAAFAAAQAARAARGTHVEAGENAEADLVDLVVRLKRYIGSRATRKDKAKQAEGQALLEPLTTVLEKAERERAARETRKKSEAAKGTKEPSGDGSVTTGAGGTG